MPTIRMRPDYVLPGDGNCDEVAFINILRIFVIEAFCGIIYIILCKASSVFLDGWCFVWCFRLLSKVTVAIYESDVWPHLFVLYLADIISQKKSLLKENQRPLFKLNKNHMRQIMNTSESFLSVGFFPKAKDV